MTNDALVPLPDAQVYVIEGGANDTTDQDGVYEVQGVPAGTVHVLFQKLGYTSVQRSVELEDGGSAELSVRLDPLAIEDPYHTTGIQDGLIGCGLLGKTNEDPNASHNIVAACGVFGNLGYHDIDKFHLAWPMGSLDETSGAWGETTWTPTQAAGKGLSILWTVWDSSNPGGAYSFIRANSVNSPISVRITSESMKQILEERDTIDDCTVDNCTLHTYHYGRAETLGTPVDVGLSLQQRYSEYFTLFFNQELPMQFSALPDQ